VNVKSLIRHRLNEVSLRDKRKDDYHLALVIEAGGVRASSAGGMAQAISGIDFVFDSVHGASAGACAAAYFSTNQTNFGEEIFVKHLPKKSIMSLKKVFEVPSVVEVDLIVDKILKFDAPLNSSFILENQSYLNIVVSNRFSGKSETISTFKDEKAVFNALRASLRVPGPLDKGIKINNKYYLDGGYLSPISLDSVKKVKATHVLVLCAQRPQDYSYFTLVKVIPELIFLFIFHGYRFAIGYAKGIILSKKAIDSNNFESIKLDKIIRNRDGVKCGLITTNSQKIQRSWAEGVIAGKKFLSYL